MPSGEWFWIDTAAREAPAKQALVLVRAVDFGRVEQRDAQVDGIEQRRLAFRRVRPAGIGEAHAHAAEAQGRGCQALPAEPTLPDDEFLLTSR
jgi:hypothetical protein